MSRSRSLTSIDVSEYDRIESAMAESERGRWFLSEYARRNRGSDTEVLLDAIARLEGTITREREDEHLVRVRGDLMDMAHAIARTKAEIAAINAPDHDQSRLGGASMALDAIVRSTEQATSDILSAAEDVQEAAWTLRESGSDAQVCNELDRRATAIYTACSFQDLTAQRTARIIHTLRYLEERLASMMAIWGDELTPVPTSGTAVAPAIDLSQSDVDRFIDMEAASSTPPEPAPERLAEAAFEAQPPLETMAPVQCHAEAGADEVSDDAWDLQNAPGVAEMDASGAVMPDALLLDPQPEPAAETEAEPNLAGMDEAVPTLAPEPVHVEPVDEVALKMSEAAATVPEPSATEPVEKTDIASAFADIDGLSEDEKLALFS